ncbi:Lrp/AsnC family transcriptional regulator, partial [Sphingorhabdus sp.]
VYQWRKISANLAQLAQDYCVLAGRHTMEHLDRFDRAILKLMQENASLSYAEIGSRVNLSASATLRRVQRMKDNGTILAVRAIVDPDKVGHPLTIIAEISLESESTAQLESIKERLIGDPFVQQCYYVTGDADLISVILVPNMADYKAFTERHFTGNANIKRFKTTVVMDRLKVTSVIPV